MFQQKSFFSPFSFISALRYLNKIFGEPTETHTLLGIVEDVEPSIKAVGPLPLVPVREAGTLRPT